MLGVWFALNSKLKTIWNHHSNPYPISRNSLSAMYQFVCTFLLQKALFETKKLIFAFDKVLKATFSKKLCFEIWKKSTFTQDNSSKPFAKANARFINIIVGGCIQLPNCPNMLLKTQFYSLINQRITPLWSSPHAKFLSSLCSTTEQASPCCYKGPLTTSCLVPNLSCLSLFNSKFWQVGGEESNQMEEIYFRFIEVGEMSKGGCRSCNGWEEKKHR